MLRITVILAVGLVGIVVAHVAQAQQKLASSSTAKKGEQKSRVILENAAYPGHFVYVRTKKDMYLTRDHATTFTLKHTANGFFLEGSCPGYYLTPVLGNGHVKPVFRPSACTWRFEYQRG